MLQSELNRKVNRFADIARRERPESPDIIQKTKAVRYPPGGSQRTYAKITQSLCRGNITAGVEEIDHYKIRLMTSGTPDWEGGHDYTKGYVVKVTQDSKTIYRECTKPHTSNSSDKKWDNDTYWKDSEGDVDAWVHGYNGNLLYTIPWFQVDEIVEVVSRQDFDDEDKPTGDTKWYILETVVKTEEIVEDARHYSLLWNQDENRAMAVFG